VQKAKFRVGNISIEGFKGFTDKHEIPFFGKHAFLFGENGCGKSSVVEAIRWCLFGLADRPETEVRNAYYASSECDVDLELIASDGKWHFHRSLRPGAERSRLVIADPTGKEVQLLKVFPHLARMGPREGTHIIFAAQQASGRRPQTDISDFHKVLYAYLHLEEVPEMLERFDKLLEEQQSVRDELASEIGDIEEKLRTKLDQVNLELNELLRNPPWIGSVVPTRAESNVKINAFVLELATLVGQTMPEASPEELLEKSEEWLQILEKSAAEDLEKTLLKMRDRAKVIKDLLQSWTDVEKQRVELKESIERLKKEIGRICEGQSLEDLNETLDLVHKRLVAHDAKLGIAKDAEEYLKSHAVTECPVCLSEYPVDELNKKVRASIEKAGPELSTLSVEHDRLQTIHVSATQLYDQLKESEKRAQRAQDEQTSVISQIKQVLAIASDSQLNEEDARTRLAEIENSVDSLASSLQATESKHAELGKRIESLRTELRFHKYRNEQDRLQRQLAVGLQSIHDEFRELTELDNTVHDVKKELKLAFEEAIDRAIPSLNDMMSDVFHKLTGQASFEKISIQRMDTERGLVLHFLVGSDRIPGQFFNPEDVLNGQANSALRLVPYFVFSEFQSETLELDLLLIDDPSQSFDTSHVGSLLKELSKAGSHAQLVIATHEEDRFGPLLNNHFHTSDFEVIKFIGFDPAKGPSFVIN
jgi:DNA repair exonuclease SbcCD ATPase subunit